MFLNATFLCFEKICICYQPAAEVSDVHFGLEPEDVKADIPSESEAKGDSEAEADILATEKGDTAAAATPESVFEPPYASTAKKEGGT